MSEVEEGLVPASLLKLEALRLEKVKYFGIRRALSERSSELQYKLKAAREELAELSLPRVRYAMGEEKVAEALLVNRTVTASVEAMLAMVNEELAQLEPMERNAALFQEAHQLWLERMRGWMRDVV